MKKNAIDVAKTVMSGAITIGTEMAVSNLITATTPRYTRTIWKVCMHTAGFFGSMMLSEKLDEYMRLKVDDIVKEGKHE